MVVLGKGILRQSCAGAEVYQRCRS